MSGDRYSGGTGSDDLKAASTCVTWTIYSRLPAWEPNQWVEWITLFTESDGREFLAEHRIEYPHYEIELRKVTTTEERVDA